MSKIQRRRFLSSSIGVGLAALARRSISQDANNSDSLHFKTVSQLSSMLANGKFNSEEIVTAVTERQAEVNDVLNAVIWSSPEADAISAAKSSDRRRAAGKSKSSIDGIPFTMKDNIWTSGIPTTNGCPELKGYRPIQDATLVKRLKDAGAILLGKTNVPEMCMDGDTNNVLFGRTCNPYGLDRVPGGSSGGEAAIIAAGGSPFGVGTDIGGSIRQPAHCCGIVGIKPTTGRVPDTGMFDSFHPSVWHWNGIGPMARSVDDLALILQIISGPDGKDPKSLDIPLRNYRDVHLGQLRVLALEEDGFSKPTSAMQELLIHALSVIHQSVLKVDRTILPFFHTGFDRWVFSQIPSWAIAIRSFRKQYARQGNSPEIAKHHFQVDWLLKVLGDWENKFDDERKLSEQLELHEFCKKMTEAMRDFDVMITPESNGPAPMPTTEAEYATLTSADFDKFKSAGHFNHPFNILGWPAVVVRCGTSEEGLPLGLQVIAKPWREDLALAVAAELEKQLGGWKAPIIAGK